MKRLLKYLLIAAMVCGLAFAVGQPLLSSYQAGQQTNWRTAKVTRGRILFDVRATGVVKAVLSVTVGTFVSGPIIELNTEHNQVVKKGDLLARIDPRLYQAAVSRDEASLDSRRADVQRVSALYQQAVRNEKRAMALREENSDFISPREMDQFHFERVSLEAQL